MRTLTQTTLLTTLTFMGLGLSGCSQISNVFKGKSATDSTVRTETTLRSTPVQDYGFGDDAFEVDLYEAPVNYAGYDVELYDTSQYYYYGYNDAGLRPLATMDRSDPREASFVKLNGRSQATDWQNCETRHNGYLLLSEYDVRLDPGFEVCMRNKGYVLTSEAGVSEANGLSAATAGLRGYAQSPSYSTGSFYR